MKIKYPITHSNIEPLLRTLEGEPYFQPGSGTPDNPASWYRQEVILEVPTGELTRDGLTTLALLGKRTYESARLTGKEGFDAQGLEGKVRIRKDLFGALMNLRDIIPLHRGRIVRS